MLFGRHAREFARALERGQWERTPQGIHFPQQGALLYGEFAVGGSAHRNLLTDFALASLADGLRNVGPLLGTQYVALWGADLTPNAQWTDYYLAAVAGEYGDAPEGYTEGLRPAWTSVDVGARRTDNSGAPALFTIATATQLPVYGFALIEGTNVKRDGLATAMSFDATTATSQTLAVDEATVYGRHRSDLFMHDWYDPNNDDFWSPIDGHWIDPSGDDVVAAPFPQTIFAIVRAVGLYNNADVVDVTYALVLQ